MQVAAFLQKFEWEVLELAPDEFARWLVYMREAEKAQVRKK